MLTSSQLPTDAGYSGQPTTQNPQGSAPGGFGGNNASEVQPVSVTDSLTTTQVGIPLIVYSLPVVGLGATATTAQVASKPVVMHKTNDIMLGFAATLFVAAVVLFWSFTRQAKITTK